MKTFLAPLCICLSLIPFDSFCQVLHGKTLDEYGDPAVKVNVSTSKSPATIVTGKDGRFQLLIGTLPDTLVFSSPGFEPYKIAITEGFIKDPSFEIVLLTKRTYYDKIKPYKVPEIVADTFRKTPVGDVALKINSKDLGVDTSDNFKEGAVAADLRLPILDSLGRSMFIVPIFDSLGNVSVSDTVYSSSGFRMSSPAGNMSPQYDMLYSPRNEDAVSVNLNHSRGYDIDSSGINDSSLYRVQLLTAAEVNDFDKWEMWGSLATDEFREWSDFWTMTPTKRYTIQLLNNDFSTLANRHVYLIDKITKEKVWSAITDNTGKAELWGDFNGKQNKKSGYSIKDDAGNVISTAVPFENGINHIISNAPCTISNAVDIAFVVDATGSMGDELGYLKLELEEVIRKTSGNNSNLDLKMGAVFYRDKGDDYITKHIDFQSDLLKVINFIKLQHADQGGDDPEAVDSALDVALNKLTWRKEARTRLMFLVLDAPPHDEAKAKIYRLILQAAAMGVRIIPISCSGSGKNNEYLLRTMALATNGTYIFLTDDSGIGEAHTVASTDSYTVELLDNLLQRIIEQFSYVSECNAPPVSVAIEPPVRQPKNIVHIKIYPNPSDGKFSIESDEELKEVYISDFTGKLLMKLTSITKGSWQANISNYPSGTYLVRYVTLDDTWGSEKIILLH